MSNAISAQGTLIARAPFATPTVFTTIAELRDIGGPALTRNQIETTNQNEGDESIIVGVRRKGDLTFQIGYLPDDPTHDHLTGLVKAWLDGSRDIYKVTFPDASTWAFSGYVTSFEPSMPVDDGLVADVTVKPTGGHTFTV